MEHEENVRPDEGPTTEKYKPEIIFETSENIQVIPNFAEMGLKEELLKGKYP